MCVVIVLCVLTLTCDVPISDRWTTVFRESLKMYIYIYRLDILFSDVYTCMQTVAPLYPSTYVTTRYMYSVFSCYSDSCLFVPVQLLPAGYDGSLENESYPTSDEEEEPDEDESGE